MDLTGTPSLDTKFDLDAGLLCLDFTNTLDWHASDHPIEMLTSYADLVNFGLKAGLLNAEGAARLLEAAQERRYIAKTWLIQAIRLRGALYRVFVAIAHSEEGAAVDPADLDIITGFWQQAAHSLRLVEEAGEFRWQWALQPDDLARVILPVVQSAVNLLQSDDRQRIGQCEDDRGCGWLFLDTSRNRSRRWCSMDSCGNRAKAARHHARSRQS